MSTLLGQTKHWKRRLQKICRWGEGVGSILEKEAQDENKDWERQEGRMQRDEAVFRDCCALIRPQGGHLSFGKVECLRDNPDLEHLPGVVCVGMCTTWCFRIGETIGQIGGLDLDKGGVESGQREEDDLSGQEKTPPRNED
ncbi:hypothetical protein JTE90_018673 [Oedothorax gibbosus]|uniref:Uncharacterized protein n=1 Tax=Oedothorax gibbosus TaxID=931172 RepID=A0AAV6V055_9ARAC|nr:hypothetical protein JTE90_018673 [Oedothorax gibbosus]